jgi:signal transduction histidine kinase
MLSEIMRDERLGPLGSSRYRAYASDIYESAAHANAVLAAFLDPAGIGRPTGAPLEFVELDLVVLVASHVSALVPVAERAGVALSGQLTEGLPRVIADRRSVRQMLNNLISNALKYTPPGGGVVVTVNYAAGGPVTIEVADTGDGISPAELDQIRSGGAGSDALRRRSGGTGIGLPLVRALAAAGGAAFDIDSRLGRGTTVTIAFPHDRVVPV